MTESSYQFDNVQEKFSDFIVLSGCSGGGKSTLLAALKHRGFAVFEEPGRQIVKEQQFIGGTALPWSNPRYFVELAVSRSMHQMALAARTGQRTFFDRGVVDAVSFLEHLHQPVPSHLETAARRLRYHQTVFMAPPWREIFVSDAERKHDFEDALASYASLRRTYERLGYMLAELPKIDIGSRVNFVVSHLAMFGQ